MTGARLAYVVVELEGVVTRTTHRFDKRKGIIATPTKMPAGYLVYFPRGHALRFKSEEELVRYGLSNDAPIINMQGLHDPNSPIGKLLRKQDEKSRDAAFEQLEQQVIALATARSGRQILPEQYKGLAADEPKEAA